MVEVARRVEVVEFTSQPEVGKPKAGGVELASLRLGRPSAC